jgi:hypothetical protein
MSTELVIEITAIILGGIGTIFLALIVWGIKALIASVLSAKHELAIIKEQLRFLIEDTKAIPKMKEDLNVLHSKVKTMQGAKP